MALSDEDRVRFGRMGVEYAHQVADPDATSDTDLLVALRMNYDAALRQRNDADKREALTVMVEACKRRLVSMRRKTVQMKRGGSTE
jgi:hypothetical protein